MQRREFLQCASVAAMAGLTAPLRGQATTTNPATTASAAILPTITLGRTGRTLPRLGLGGYPVCTLASDDNAIKVLQQVFARGIRYIDTAPSYGNGLSEKRIGAALAAFGVGVARSEFFIATKTLKRDADSARRELEQSLKRLQLDYVDSIQCHEVHDDWQKLFARNSVLAGLKKARDEGLVRHIGITGHRHPRYLIECLDRFDFATALVPINPLDKQHLSFITEFLPVAIGKKVPVIAMKIFAGGHLIQKDGLTASECLHYALSQEGVAIAVPGLGSIEEVDASFNGVKEFKPLSSDEQKNLETRAGKHMGKSSEWYKEEE